ncbi:MAG: sensor domain-containing diguanylate cyclase [Desulfobacteraceae bacterium]|nr:sensor domain-containing diguanylate cyclase [Desulfobacteraceae bacterium]
MKPDAFEKIGFGLGTEELYEIALDQEIMRLRERVLRSHTELMLQGLQKLVTSQTAEDGLLNILHALNQSESMDGSFVLVSSPDGSFRVFSSTIAECRETVWHPGPMFERLFSAGKPVILHDLGHSSEWRKQPALMGKYRSAVHAPFRFGTFRAAIVCVSARRGYINHMHAKLMFRLGPLLTQALILIDQVHQLKTAKAELEEKSIQLENALNAATHLARTDYLTQIHNRRCFFDVAEKELRRVRRYNIPLSVIMLDIDDFKAINDQFGHGVGDAVLKEVATLCRSVLREFDTLARYGGEEFVALLPGSTKAQALNVAERIRQAVAKASLNQLPADRKITVSLGVAGKNDPDCDIDALVDEADQALLQAKQKGKNRVEPG